LDIETKLLSYLHKYGNTKERDLIEYGTRSFGLSRKELKKVLDKMIVEGNARRIIHDKLGPNVAYAAEADCVALNLALQVETDALGIKDKEKVVEEARKILEEAAAKAQKRIDKKYPDMFK
jgi:division protein CdvB (Snf7/Vps24/ESCRT-III family)